jgi:FixJ family two-component response regulator
MEYPVEAVSTNAHRRQVMRKMHAASLPDPVTMATRLGLAPVRDAPAIGSDHR